MNIKVAEYEVEIKAKSEGSKFNKNETMDFLNDIYEMACFAEMYCKGYNDEALTKKFHEMKESLWKATHDAFGNAL